MDTDTQPIESLPLFLQLAQPCPKPHWRHVRNIKGKGSAKFLKTLSYPHLANGRTGVTRYKRDEWGRDSDYKGYRYHRIVSHVAIAVWNDFEQRNKWLTHHKALSRLIG